MAKRPKHLTTRAGRPRYFREVPRDLKAVVGRKAWTRYFDSSWSLDAVKREVERLDAEHNAFIRRLRSKGPAWLAQCAERGGVKAMEGEAERVRIAVELWDEMRPPQFGCDDEADSWAADEARARSQLSRIEPVKGLDVLVSGPMGRAGLRRLQTYVDRFKAARGGDTAPKDVTKADVVKWRDAMARGGVSGANAAQQLAKVSAAFARAVSAGTIATNPFDGIRATYAGEERTRRQRRRSFTAEELAHLIAASSTQNPPFDLIIRCLLFVGARSNEVCGLLVGDVVVDDGVLVFDFAGNELRGVKNRASVRVVPVPSLVRAEVLALCAGRGWDAPLFEGLPKRAQGPAHQLQIDSSKIIRAHVSKDRRLTLHSLRNTWRQRARLLGVAPAVSRAVLGHAEGDDDHDLTYDERPAAVELAKAVEAVSASLWADVVGGKVNPQNGVAAESNADLVGQMEPS